MTKINIKSPTKWNNLEFLLNRKTANTNKVIVWKQKILKGKTE